MIPLSHLSSVQCEQVKFRPSKKVRIKVTHSVEAAGWGWGAGSKAVKHGLNFFNLISLTISDKAFFIGNNRNTSYFGLRRF